MAYFQILVKTESPTRLQLAIHDETCTNPHLLSDTL
jgi:hypothetical protein